MRAEHRKGKPMGGLTPFQPKHGGFVGAHLAQRNYPQGRRIIAFLAVGTIT